MALRCGIVGLPNVGKSTIFNALTTSAVPAENYPFCTIEPYMGIVPLPDPRLKKLKKYLTQKKLHPRMLNSQILLDWFEVPIKGRGLVISFSAKSVMWMLLFK